MGTSLRVVTAHAQDTPPKYNDQRIFSPRRLCFSVHLLTSNNGIHFHNTFINRGNRANLGETVDIFCECVMKRAIR